jgi:hypothetical protein
VFLTLRRHPMNEHLKQNQELRAAMRKVFWPPSRLGEYGGVEELAKRASKTPEGYINADIDTFIDGGWGDVFQIFHRNHGRYPEQAETAQAAEEYRQVAESSRMNMERCMDLGSMNPDRYGKPPRGPGNPKLDFYLGELVFCPINKWQ